MAKLADAVASEAAVLVACGFESRPEHSSITVKPWPAEPPAFQELWQASSRQGDDGIDVQADVVWWYSRSKMRQGPYRSKEGYVFWTENVNGKTRTVYEHREKMEIHLGRRLRGHEVVHHKNQDPSDNRLENLEVMTRGATHCSPQSRT